ncbi:hypothetical protein NN561_019177 [Cricetulus griseus]
MLITLLIASELGTSGELSAGQARSAAGPGLQGRHQCCCGCRGKEGGRRGARPSLKVGKELGSRLSGPAQNSKASVVSCNPAPTLLSLSTTSLGDPGDPGLGGARPPLPTGMLSDPEMRVLSSPEKLIP